MPTGDLVTVDGRTYVVVWDGSVLPSEGRRPPEGRIQTQPGVLQGEILRTLRAMPDLSLAALAARLNRTPDRVKACLYRLMRRGAVTRSLRDQDWRYHVPDPSICIDDEH